MAEAAPRGIFERRPRATLLALALAGLLLIEAALRLLAPSVLVFVYRARQIHAYSERFFVDLLPRRSVRLRLVDSRGRNFYNFLLTTNDAAFRSADRDRDGSAETGLPSGCEHFVHAVGDSYTMGWGVGQESSYPALLDELLPPDTCVLNLGVDGFGTIAATEKSMDLAGRFPPRNAVYLFSPNDFEDDARALRVAARSRPAQLAFHAFDLLRRHTFLANVPYAINVRRRFGAVLRAAGSPRDKQPLAAAAPERWLLHPDLRALPEAPPAARASLAQISKYRDFLARRGGRLYVLVLSAQPPALAFYRHCREQGIPADVFDLPAPLQLDGDGHFNRQGNAALARLVAERGLGLAAPAASGGVGSTVAP